MPELPEVETIRLGLQKYLVGVKPRGGHATLRGHKIVGVEVKLKKIVTGDTSTSLSASIQHVIGSRIIGVRRFGKGLVIDLDNNYCIAIHIKLTGQLIYTDKNKKPPKEIKVIKDMHSSLPNKWTHVIFSLDRGAMLYYNDFRQFGWIKILKKDDLKTLEFFRDLGPEFFKDLTIEKFSKILSKSKIAIKPLLMDQKKMSGLGNIYANDGLNLAKIDPRRSASSLNKNEVQTLFHALEKVLKNGLKYGGASELSYVNALGQEGSYQNHFLVYGREGKPCKNCGTILKKIKLAGRGTYFCPKCQR